MFVCGDELQAQSLMRVADHEVTGRHSRSGRPKREWLSPGRERMWFVAERDMHEENLRANSRLAPSASSWNGHVHIELSFARTGTVPGATGRFSRSSRSASGATITAMRSTPLLTEAKPVSGYTVSVRFEDGTAGEVDLSYLLDYGGVFEPLRDPEYFRQLRADPEAGTIVWPNEADIAPETLYAHARGRTAATA